MVPGVCCPRFAHVVEQSDGLPWRSDGRTDDSSVQGMNQSSITKHLRKPRTVPSLCLRRAIALRHPPQL